MGMGMSMSMSMPLISSNHTTQQTLPSSSSSSSHAVTSTQWMMHPQSHVQGHPHAQGQSHGQGLDLGCASSHSLFFPDEDLAAVIAQQGVGKQSNSSLFVNSSDLYFLTRWIQLLHATCDLASF